jgi:hypothetical protein
MLTFALFTVERGWVIVLSPRAMSALGSRLCGMWPTVSALPPKADMRIDDQNVCLGPETDMPPGTKEPSRADRRLDSEA